jgi:hypothetical protein
VHVIPSPGGPCGPLEPAGPAGPAGPGGPGTTALESGATIYEKYLGVAIYYINRIKIYEVFAPQTDAVVLLDAL